MNPSLSVVLTLAFVLASTSALMGPFDKEYGPKRFRIDPLAADGSYPRERRSFYTTRFGKRSDSDEAANAESSTENPNPEVPESSAPVRSGSSFYTTRFGRRADPGWTGRALAARQRQTLGQDDLYEGGQQDMASDPYARSAQQLVSDHIKCHFLGLRNPVICKFGDGVSEYTFSLNDDDY